MDQLVVDWKGLKTLGVPYSRAHVWRLMGTGEFPQSFKLGPHRNSHPVWWLSDITAWFQAHANGTTVKP